jgi:multimeric flavodoxin WrbA
MDKKILMTIGSPRPKGYSTYLAHEAGRALAALGAGVDEVRLNDLDLKACRACDSCRTGRRQYCVLDDGMRDLYPRIADGGAIVIAAPVYWFSVNAQTKLFIDRLYGLNTERTGVLKDRRFGIILAYGDEDPYSSGAVNAIRMYQDSFRYTGSVLAGLIYKKDVPEKDRRPDPGLEEEVLAFAKALVS